MDESYDQMHHATAIRALSRCRIRNKRGQETMRADSSAALFSQPGQGPAKKSFNATIVEECNSVTLDEIKSIKTMSGELYKLHLHTLSLKLDHKRYYELICNQKNQSSNVAMEYPPFSSIVFQ